MHSDVAMSSSSHRLSPSQRLAVSMYIINFGWCARNYSQSQYYTHVLNALWSLKSRCKGISSH